LKKYKILKSKKLTIVNPVTQEKVILYRIKSLKTFSDVKKGQLGGWIEKESNLSQEGNCWIYNEAKQYGNSVRSENAVSYGNAQSFGNSRQYGNSQQYGDSQQYENSQQYGHSRQYGNSQQYGNSRQYGDYKMFEEHHQFTGENYKDVTKMSKREALRYQLLIQLNITVFDKERSIILYKRVNKTANKNVFTSLYSKAFKYTLQKKTTEKGYSKTAESCEAGLHFSTPSYWSGGDSLLSAKINLSDIITVQAGKVRCKACLPLKAKLV